MILHIPLNQAPPDTCFPHPLPSSNQDKAEECLGETATRTAFIPAHGSEVQGAGLQIRPCACFPSPSKPDLCPAAGKEGRCRQLLPTCRRARNHRGIRKSPPPSPHPYQSSLCRQQSSARWEETAFSETPLTGCIHAMTKTARAQCLWSFLLYAISSCPPESSTERQGTAIFFYFFFKGRHNNFIFVWC